MEFLPRLGRLPARVAPAGDLSVPAGDTTDRAARRGRAADRATDGAAGHAARTGGPARAVGHQVLAASAGAAPSRRAGTLPAATATPISQNSEATPSAAPTAPNNSGISELEKLIVIERSAIASPWRCGG